MIKVRWSRPARNDLANIGAYWREHSPGRTGFVADKLDEAASFLAATPKAGPALEGTSRKWRVRGTDYILAYRPVGDGIEILRVYHVRQDRSGTI